MLGLVPLDVEADLLLDRGQMVEPLPHLVGHPDARQIGVAVSVAEPPAHLQQGVVGRRRADEERDRQALERQSPRQRVSADGDDHARVVVVEVEALILGVRELSVMTSASSATAGSSADTSSQATGSRPKSAARHPFGLRSPQIAPARDEERVVASASRAGERSQVRSDRVGRALVDVDVLRGVDERRRVAVALAADAPSGSAEEEVAERRIEALA